MPSMTAAVSIAGRCSLRGCLLAALLLATGADQDKIAVSLTEEGSEERVATVAADRGHALRLNAQTFKGNVLQAIDGSERVSHWVVGFCPSWWEPCQNLELPFDQLSLSWERKLNTALMTKQVRFAIVDCATDKVLCNEEDVETYPTVHHYHKGKREATWRGGRRDDAAKFSAFVKKRLSEIKESRDLAREFNTLDANVGQGSFSQYLMSGDRTFDLLLAVFVLSLNAWVVFTNPQLWRKQAATGTGEPVSVAEPCRSATVPCTAEKPVAEPTPEPASQAAPAVSVARFLPKDWASPCEGMEL